MYRDLKSMWNINKSGLWGMQYKFTLKTSSILHFFFFFFTKIDSRFQIQNLLVQACFWMHNIIETLFNVFNKKISNFKNYYIILRLNKFLKKIYILQIFRSLKNIYLKRGTKLSRIALKSNTRKLEYHSACRNNNKTIHKHSNINNLPSNKAH